MRLTLSQNNNGSIVIIFIFISIVIFIVIFISITSFFANDVQRGEQRRGRTTTLLPQRKFYYLGWLRSSP